MEMMPPMMMELDELPADQQFPLPFQDLSGHSPLLEFSGGSSTTSHHTPPQLSHLLYRNLPPIIMPSQHVRALRDFPRGNWFQQKPDSVEAMREMIFQMAALQPVQIDPESVKPPKRRNVKISKDPQSVAARHRRERISERIRILQRLVPGGTKMDTASMLDEAAHYMKFLKKQVQSLEQQAAAEAAASGGGSGGGVTIKTSTPNGMNNVGTTAGCCTTSTSMNGHNNGINNNNSSNNNHSNLRIIKACGQPAAANNQASHMLGSMELLR